MALETYDFKKAGSFLIRDDETVKRNSNHQGRRTPTDTAGGLGTNLASSFPRYTSINISIFLGGIVCFL